MPAQRSKRDLLPEAMEETAAEGAEKGMLAVEFDVEERRGWVEDEEEE